MKRNETLELLYLLSKDPSVPDKLKNYDFESIVSIAKSYGYDVTLEDLLGLGLSVDSLKEITSKPIDNSTKAEMIQKIYEQIFNL